MKSNAYGVRRVWVSDERSHEPGLSSYIDHSGIVFEGLMVEGSDVWILGF